MARKRKRADPSHFHPQESGKRAKVDAKPELVKHPALCLYYAQTLTLRAYLLSKLPVSSKRRRRRVASARDSLLDEALVCTTRAPQPEPDVSRFQHFETFSQQVILTAGSSIEVGSSSQSDLIDFAIWLLFHKNHRHAHRPPHMLCHGFQRATHPRQLNEDHCALAGIPGLVSHYPNGNVDTLKDAAWTEILGLLGKEGDRIMLDLILDCSIFAAVDGGRGNYYQLSGIPMTELPPLGSSKPLILELAKAGPVNFPNSTGCPFTACKTPAAITFVRNRMFYARAALNAKGRVTFGLRHIHVLNRYSDSGRKDHTVHVMKYIFPRQFGLHNVFTSVIDSKETIQPFKDYTLREQEIIHSERRAASIPKPSNVGLQSIREHMPKRLRGEAFDLVRKLQINHSRCSYHQLVLHYCPLKKPAKSRKRTTLTKMTPAQIETQVSMPHSSSAAILIDSSLAPEPPKQSLVSFATPQSEVSMFCRAALSELIPNRFLGEGAQIQENKSVLLHSIDRFVRLRRFENMSLHVVCQNIKLNSMVWLTPAHIDPSTKVAISDMKKREEIFQEFIYYVFDSLLIPLIRSNFHVTQSNVHQNRLFYFRHDVWRSLTEPAMSKFKISMFEEIKTLKARKLLDARALGFSQIRLSPKANGVRPITNLRRRVAKLQNGKVTLGRSINSIMAPVFNVLDYEKRKQPELTGSALFSVGEMYPKLKSFAQVLRANDAAKRSLYFAKADAKSCFDTIPQQKVVRLMQQIASQDEYRIARHAEIKSSDNYIYGAVNQNHPRPARKFISIARGSTDFPSFDEVVAAEFAKARKNTVFVDNVVQVSQQKTKMLDLLEDHVERNIIKIGKKFFRQKAGIPQGSVLSSLLCNYLYAELEKECIGFLKGDESILLRLIDDFLLITTNKSHAQRFLQIMHDGIEDYGVEVNPAKSLANFETVINGHQVPELQGGRAFPYCGNMIDTKTLEITKDRDRRIGTVLADTLTVEPSKVPGKTFYLKALNAFKIQTHKMFLDTNFNSTNTVLTTIYENFAESAMKYYRYAKCMSRENRPHLGLLIGTIHHLVDLASVLIKGKHKSHVAQDYSCTVSKCQVQWLAAKAFRTVLGRKQSKYGEVIAWLDVAIGDSAANSRKEARRLDRIAKQGEAVFRGYKF